MNKGIVPLKESIFHEIIIDEYDLCFGDWTVDDARFNDMEYVKETAKGFSDVVSFFTNILHLSDEDFIEKVRETFDDKYDESIENILEVMRWHRSQ